MNKHLSRALRPFSGSPRLFLLLFLLLAFILRLYHIDAFSFWTDEGLTPLRSGYSIAEILSNRIIIQEGVTNDTHPPLYYLLIHFTRQLFGETDFAFRYPSVLANMLLLPVIYQLGRRLQGQALGATAVLLAAINPVHVWYANEARMYMLFLLLAAAATYVLLRTLQTAQQAPNRALIRNLALYLLLAGLALYTHYTAVFLIGAQALFWIWILWRRGQQKVIIGTAVVGILAALPLIPYTVPRLFRGVEANFFYVPPLVMLQDVVRFFNLGVTVDFKEEPIQLLTVAAFLLLLLGVYAAKTWTRRLFLFAYLLAVVIGLMLGSLIKPMYQGVRHIMVGSPAFLLLVAWGVVYLWQRAGNRYSAISNQYSVNSEQTSISQNKPPNTDHRSPITAHRSPLTDYRLPITDYRFLLIAALALAATAVLLIGPAISLSNYYTNEKYAKDDFRSAIHFMERHAGDNDVIVYNNAILLPLHNHYRDRTDVAVTASPIYPTRAENTSPAQLTQLAATYDRIWFVTDPPADQRDANQLVQRWLNENLALIDETPFPARTTRLSTLVYSTDERYLDALPSGSSPPAQPWPALPPLAGVQIDGSQPIDTPALWIDLFWRRGSRPPNDATLTFQLIGPDDQPWATISKPFVSEDASITWQGDGLVRLSYDLPLPLGTPPGSYALRMMPTGPDGIPLADALPLAEVAYGGLSTWTAVAGHPFTTYQHITFENGLSLQGMSMPDQIVRPGHALPLFLFWQADADTGALSDVTYRLEVIDDEGTLLRRQQDPAGPRWLDVWPPAMLMREETGLYFPPETEPGRYRFRWQLFDGDTPVGARPFWWPWPREAVIFGQVSVVPWPLQTDLPTDATVVNAAFGDAIRLYGYTLDQTAAALNLTLYWQAQAVPAQNYFIFVHLVDPDGNIVAQRDVVPVDGLRPTGGWRTDEVLTDEHTLALPPNLPPGDYTVRVGLFVPDTFVRPPVTIDGVPQPDNQIELTTVTLP